ncbi:PLP-dependent transferase [Polychaeton citri CBS 116435]|uniref:PLP-dependent transferase n=1 Tax=Polychaeton citri CBS 116435 TaxID=1314669 RepID=A0A9P4UUR0_9PEZI|nr:PLP-dependent transferase [Polychaeton citri CBS 116435]
MGEAPPRSPINLMRGWPSYSLLPTELIKQASLAALSDPSIALPGLEYGPDPGYQPAREAIADWLSRFFKPTAGPVSAGRICVTGGASQSLGCILQAFTDPEYTRNIWLVAPSYFLAFFIFEDAGFANKMRAVPEDDEGLDMAYLEQELRESEQQAQQDGNLKPRYKSQRPGGKLYKHVIYCVPTFSNPSSRTMSLARRQQLVRIARKFDALVICDDVYDFLQWDAEAEQKPGQACAALTDAHLPRVVDVDRTLDGGAERESADGFGNACSNGSFSKIAGPGVRCGWFEGAERLSWAVSQTGTQRSGGAPSQLTSTFITDLLQTGKLQSHINDTLQAAYRSRYGTMMRAITRCLTPIGFSAPQPDRKVVGGYFIWLSLPKGLKALPLAQACLEEGVIIAEGEKFEVPRDKKPISFDSHIRLCFSWIDEPQLEEAVETIGRVAKTLLDGSGQSIQGRVSSFGHNTDEFK